MSLIGQLLFPERSQQQHERRALSLTDYGQWVDLGIVDETDSGVLVTPSRALRVAAVFACVRILAETVAMLPLITYEKMPRGRKRAVNHPLYTLLKDRPNSDMTAFEFRQVMQGHLALWGNGYAHIDYAGNGQVRELFPLRPDRMIQIVPVGNRWAYHYQLPGGELRWFSEVEIFHLRGLGSDGRIGYSPISLMRQAVGLAVAEETFGARFFGNDARPGGVLEHPTRLSEEAQARLLESWESRHGGLSRSHKTAILEEGLKYTEIGMNPRDSQFIEGRKFQISEIARMFRVPPHKIGDLERATFSNIEHQGLEFVTDTMLPWLTNWEQAIEQRLMLERDRERFFVEFLVDSLLRGDTQTRYEAYATARQNGWMSANDIREKENMNPIEGGDIYLVPLNLVPVRSAPAPTSLTTRSLPDRETRSIEGRVRLRTAYRNLFVETATRIVRRETNAVLRKAKALRKRNFDVPELSLWLEGFYEEHREYILRQMRPLFRNYGEAVAGEAAGELGAEPLTEAELDQLARDYAVGFAAHHVGISLTEIRSALRRAVEDGTDPFEAVEQLLADWDESRPEKVADIETVRSGNAMAIGLYAAAGVITLRWRALGESCPYCSRLDGTTVGITQSFLAANQDFQPEGAETPLRPQHDVKHPPAHAGCDCLVLAGI